MSDLIGKFWIPHIGGGWLHKDCLELVPANPREWRFCIMWYPTAVPFAWFYISKSWNVTWNVDKKWWFSIFDWRKL